MQEFNWTVRVYYEDTDASGVVYHTNYLKFMEQARTEFLRSCGYSHKELIDDENIAFAVRNIKIDYKNPARIDELLNINTRIATLGGSNIIFEQIILNDSKQMKCRADVEIVCVDSKTFKLRRIPDPIREKFNHDG